MVEAEFVPVRSHTKLLIVVRDFSGPTGLAPVEGFRSCGAGFEPGAAVGYAVLIQTVSKKGWTKKEEVVSEAHDDHHFGRERSQNEIQGWNYQAE